MKMNIRSISAKLMVSGVLVAILPLVVVGYLAYSQAHSALLTVSLNQNQSVATDLARSTRSLLEAEIHKVAIMASQRMLMELGVSLRDYGLEMSRARVGGVIQAFVRQFDSLGSAYEGMFYADMDGRIAVGVREDKSDYPNADISEAPYFALARETKTPVVSELARSEVTGHPFAVVAAPVLGNKDEFLGILGLAVKAEYFAQPIAVRKIGETGYGYMLNDKGIAIAHPNPAHVLKFDVNVVPEMATINKRMLAGEAGVEEYTFRGIDKVAGFAPVGINGWSIAATQDAPEFLAATVTIRNIIVVAALLAGIITTVIVLLAARTITGPINAAVAGLKDIAQGEGDLTLRLQVNSQDEVGELAKWFNTFIEKLQGIIRQIAGGVQTLASSSTELSAIAEQMSQAAQNTSDKSNVVATASEEMSSNMSTVAAAMEQSATNTQAVATAAEQMSATVNEIAKNSERARSISDSAAHQATETSGKMAQLGDAARAIGNVVETITDISEQVNLLALNATIEAARAGEAGKGFAVVANEIKELAKQTAGATQDIKEKIGTIQGTTALTVKDIEEITRIIQEVHDVVSGIATAVEEQSTATTEIANNVSQAAQGIQEVNTNVSQGASVANEISRDIADVNTTANEMSSSSAQVNMSAGDLSKLAEELKGMVGQFKI